MLTKELEVILLALTPVLEVRASIPFGIMVASLPFIDVLVLSLLGNLLPVVPLLMGLSAFEKWILSGEGGFKRIISKVYAKLLFNVREKGRRYIERFGFLGIIIFVAIPLPGSGVWTGCLLSHILGVRLRAATTAIAIGATIAALLIALSTVGISILVF